MDLQQLKERMLALQSIDITVGDVRKTSLSGNGFSSNCHCHMAQAFCRVLGLDPNDKMIWAGTCSMELQTRTGAHIGDVDTDTYSSLQFNRNYEYVKNDPNLPDDQVLTTLQINPNHQ